METELRFGQEKCFIMQHLSFCFYESNFLIIVSADVILYRYMIK